MNKLILTGFELFKNGQMIFKDRIVTSEYADLESAINDTFGAACSKLDSLESKELSLHMCRDNKNVDDEIGVYDIDQTWISDPSYQDNYKVIVFAEYDD